MTSIERIIEYTHLTNEENKSDKQKPPENWPMEGSIKFEKLSLSYASNLPKVLKNISLEILPSEKIGLIGRTGAGKFVS